MKTIRTAIFQKVRRFGKETELIVDPDDTSRYIKIRGHVELTDEGAIEHLDQITRQYTDHPQYYGYIFPYEKKRLETRIICRIQAQRITLDAIDKKN